MNRNHYEGRHSGAGRRPARRRGRFNARLTAIVLATVALLALAIGGTVAWLNAKTDPVENTFDYAYVTCKVIEENFDGKVKTNVNVQNTSNTYAFLRVKLVAYRTNEAGQHIGGMATIPEFTLGADWVKYGDYYYYTKPVSPDKTNNKPATNLTDYIKLGGPYGDADGGYTAIDVMAEAIQSTPEKAVQDAWGTGFGIDANGNLIVPQN